jgi:hypothetical protein
VTAVLALVAAASKMPFVFAAWGIAAVVFGLYAWAVVRRGKRLSQEVPPESRRWM